MDAIERLLNWENQKEKLRQVFTDLTDKDLLFIDGRKEEMLTKLQIKLGKTEEELDEFIHLL
jgi:uncharacterized protein YjbJ (UPF0337 family)